MPKIVSVMIRRKDKGAIEVCSEISIKDITEGCERTTLYPEENCGQPTAYVHCEEVKKKEE